MPWDDIGIHGDLAESSQVRITGQTNMGNIAVNVYYRPPNHKGADEPFFRQLEKASHAQALFPGGLEPP